MIRSVEEQKAIKDWESYVSEGMMARENKDTSSWRLGDLAGGISKDYGEDAIGKYAYAIGVERKTLMNYRTIASSFDIGLKSKYKKLSFSHFAVLTAVEKPEVWLEQANNNDWSTETLRKEVKKVYSALKEPKLDDNPPPVVKCPQCGLWRLKGMSTFEVCRGHYVFKNGRQEYK